MRPFGFSAHNVRAVVRDLLKVYGEDGWVFIEDGGYKVLLESLLEKAEEENVMEIQEYQNGNGEDENLLLEDGEMQENGIGNGEEEAEGLLLEDGEIQQCGNEEEGVKLLLEDGEVQDCGNGEAEAEILLLENGEVQECGDREEGAGNLLLEEGEIQGGSYTGDVCDKDTSLEKIFGQGISEAREQQYEMPPLMKEDSPQVPVEALYDSFAPKTIMPMNSETGTRKSEPCCGWIDDDDDSDADDDILSYVPLTNKIS